MSRSITWIGQPGRDEFRPAWEELIQTETCTPVDSIAAARTLKTPDVLILAMSRPQQYAASDVEALQAEWPTTRFIYLLGAWCCGEKRVSSEHTRVPTLYFHQLQSGNVRRLILELENVDDQASDFEIPHTSLSLAVYARSASYRDGIAESLSATFPRNVQLQFGDKVPTRGIDIVVWESSPYQDERTAELEELKIRHPDARIIALVSYPRDFEFAEMHAQEITVVSQPFSTIDLLHAIDPVGQVSTWQNHRQLARAPVTPSKL